MPLLASAPSSVWFSAEVFREFRKRWADGQGYASQFHKRDSGLESETACLIGQCVPERRAKADPEEFQTCDPDPGPWRALPVDDISTSYGWHHRRDRLSRSRTQASTFMTIHRVINGSRRLRRCWPGCESALREQLNFDIMRMKCWYLHTPTIQTGLWSSFSSARDLHLILCINRPLSLLDWQENWPITVQVLFREG